MIRIDSAFRRGSIILSGALLLGLLQPAPAFADPSIPADDGQAELTVRSQGDDMVPGIEGAASVDQLQSEAEEGLDLPALAAYSVSNHTVDVAVVEPSDTTAGTDFITDAAITAMLAEVGASWKTQSNNQIQSVRLGGPVQRFRSAYPCANQGATWNEAAAKFGKANRYSYSTTASAHLLVLVPKNCTQSGLGSVGIDGRTVSAAYGGVMWVSLKGHGDVETVTHEFGHNLGLNHSNSHRCPVPTMSEGELDPTTGAFSDGCGDYGYGDSYDVMGATWSVGGGNGVVYTNPRPTALNVTHKVRLGAMASGEMATVTLPAGSATSKKSFTLTSVGLTSGLRNLAVTDPRTGQIYYVDFRGGGGTDAGSLYETGKLAGVGTAIGVRVLTTRASGASIVLNSPEKSPRTGSKLYLSAGETLSTRSGGVSVSVTGVGAGTANVSVTLAATAGTVPTPKPTVTPTTKPTPKPTVKPTAQPAPAKPVVARISGADRYATAIKVSQTGYPKTAPVVYVATGSNYPDALAAAPAAAFKGGPLLLTDGAMLPDSVKKEIQRLRPSRIVVVGGPNAVSHKTFTSLKPLASRVDRISGADRYDTARKIVKDAFGTAKEAYLATGSNYPDALSAAAAAGARDIPVLLVDGGAATIDAGTKTLIASLGVKKVTIAGGTAVVSPRIESGLRSIGVTVVRQGGSDRFETSRLINAAGFSKSSEIFLATAYQFPDALAGAALAGARTAPLYVVQAGCVPAGALNDVRRLGVSKVTLVGGVNALGSSVASLKKCP